MSSQKVVFTVYEQDNVEMIIPDEFKTASRFEAVIWALSQVKEKTPAARLLDVFIETDLKDEYVHSVEVYYSLEQNEISS